ncbi:unnamed protein product [Eruca vesicaria subsp. sativa]|uniref:DUF577 domain-containing protein n=1 Tax=Eruca vesicaria subsp. sativa TaxID=29727 RepID=A0ABC8LQQ4_ERUVS|nr:unnamed protein product [Eruca vesicaria subsp. sativa]
MRRVMAVPPPTLMAEPPPNLMLKTRDILATSSHEGLESLLCQLRTSQETALALFNFITNEFANSLTLKLLQMYQSSSNGVLRAHLIFLLFETLNDYKRRGFELSLVALNEIKPLLISCLRMQEPDLITLRQIVSFIAYDVVILDNNGWDELSECIFEISSTDPLKALHIFVDLPLMYEKFLYNCGGMIAEKAEKVLLVPYQDRVQDWSLGLQAVVKLGIQHLDSDMRFDMVKRLLILLVKAASDLVEKGMEEFLVRGLADLGKFLARDKKACNYNKEQCDFVSVFLLKIRDLGPLTMEATGKIHHLVNSSPPLVQQPLQVHGAVSEGEWLDRLNKLQPVEMLRVFASTDVEERFRELAIRQLNLLLSDRLSRQQATDVSVLRELQKLLISCLWEREGISESMFKVLGEVVYYVAFEMMISYLEIWDDLCFYITSNSKTEFERAVYIFQCLTIWLPMEFMDPIVEPLLPEINKRLNPPREVLVDNSCWVLAFVGAFCAIIQLIRMEIYAETVMEMADKMVDSVRDLVERKMEVGLVRRAFRDLEIIVKKQKEWFSEQEFKLTKSLLQRLEVIKGITMESKLVLWRIKRGMADHVAA